MREGSGFPIPDGMPTEFPDVKTPTGQSSAAYMEMIRTALNLVHFSLLEATPWMPVSIADMAEFDSDMAANVAKDRRRAPSDEAIHRLSRRLTWLNYVVKSFETHFGGLPLDLTEEYFTLRQGVEALGLMRMRQDQQALIELMHQAEEDEDFDLKAAVQGFVPLPDESHSRMLRMSDQKKDAALTFQVRHRVVEHGDDL